MSASALSSTPPPLPAYPLREDEKHPERVRWEYWISPAVSDYRKMNSLGLQGWELVGREAGRFYWKRRLP